MSNANILLRVQDASTLIEGSLESEVYKGLKAALGYKDEKAMWKLPRDKNGKPKKRQDWDGVVSTVCYSKRYCKCAIKKDGTHFPTGLLSKARDYFKSNNQSYTLMDERAKVRRKALNLSMTPEFEPRDYQQKIITDACERERGIIKMATGGGKTATASGIISELGVAPFIFYVTSIDLLKQAKDELEKFINKDGSSLEVGTIGNGKCDIKDVNIMTVQTAVRALGERYKSYDEEEGKEGKKLKDQEKRDVADLIHSCGGMICDEVQHWAAKTCQVIADHSHSARFRFGLSATPWRDEGDDLLIDSCFGKVIADVNASFLIDKGILVKPTIYFVHQPRLSCEGSYQTVYQEAIVQNEQRNMTIANIANKMVEDGRQVLVLCRYVEHGQILESLIDDSFFINGSHTGKQRAGWLQKMRDREARITIATSIFDEGVDIKPLDGLILAGSGKSQTRALQRVGRVIRTFTCPDTGTKKKDAFVVDFHDNTKYMRSHSMKRRHIYETEPAFDIKDWK